MNILKKRAYAKKISNMSAIIDNAPKDRTTLSITIDAIEAIIKTKDFFEKFMNFENNIEFFDEFKRKEILIDYMSSINAYVDYMYSIGYKFTREEKARINILTKKSQNKVSKKDSKRKKELSDVVLSILSSTSTIRRYALSSKDIQIKGFTMEEIQNFCVENKTLKSFLNLYERSSECINNYNFMCQIADINKSYHRLPTDFRIDPEMEAYVNSKIRYNPYEIEDSIYDVLKEYISKSDNNEALAQKWGELYSYFLEKNGIISFISNADSQDVKYINKFTLVQSKMIPLELTAEGRVIMYNDTLNQIKNSSYKISEDAMMDPDLEKLVMENVQFEEDKLKTAFNIYNSLNKNLIYSPMFFALNQDLTNPLASEVYYRDINGFNEDNNRVTCKNWAEMYAYLFTKYIGGESYINVKGKHKSVSCVLDDNIIMADATNTIISTKDETKLTDLTRSKLRLIPAGFNTLFYSRSLEECIRQYKIFDSNDISSDYEEKQYVDEFMKTVSDNTISDDILGISECGEIEKIIRKLKFISDILAETGLENLDRYAYFQTLRRIILTQQEKQKVLVFDNFFKETPNKNDYDLIPLISINASEQKQAGNFIYLIFDEEKGLCRVNKEKLIDLVESDKLKYIFTDGDPVVPGVEELILKGFKAKPKISITSKNKGKQIEKEDENTQK